MKKSLLLFLLLPVCAFGVESTDCSTATQLAALYEVRSLMLRPDTSSYDVNKFIDAKLDELRGPTSDGGYRWVRWARPTGSPEFDKKGHTVAAVQGSGTDNFEASGDHIYAVRVAVPSKRSMFNGNNAVYVGTVHIRAVANGRTRNVDEHIDDWMNRDTSKTIDLNMIADRVDVSLDSAAKPGRGNESLVEIHLLKAVAQDDPANPNYDTITTLRKVRDSWDSDTIDDEIARLNPNDTVPLYHIVRELRRADDLMHSKKDEEREKGERLMKEMLGRLR
jgi:hypothetical protein